MATLLTLKVVCNAKNSEQMTNIFNKYEFRVYPILIVILYVPIHILEEALNNFPEWMSSFYGLPIVLNYPHWLINNLFFFLSLIVGLVFFLTKEKYLYLGVGILFWSIMNSFEHIIGSLIFLKIAPGFYSGLLFILVSVIGFYKLRNDGKLNIKLLVISFISSLLYWIIPISLIVLTGNIWLKTLY